MKNEYTDYLKSLNPKEDQQHILVYGSTYKLWRDGKYLGEAIWEQDENVGDSFQTLEPFNHKGKAIMTTKVWIADRWELVINKKT